MREDTPSGTAYLIAGSLAASGGDPVLSTLLPPGGAELGAWTIADTLPGGVLLLWALRQGWGRGIVRLIERNVLPGLQPHYIVRKRFIEDVTRTALETGVRQVVNVGAGFDSLCWRLHGEYPEVRFLELDHPGTQRAKQKVLERRGAPQPNLRLYPADLAQTDLETALHACPHFDARLPTLFIVEAVLMYLTAEKAAGLFQAMRRLGLPETKVVFTFMEPQANGHVNFPHASRFVTWWLRRHAEPFTWGISRAELAGFLSEQGFALQELADEKVLRERYLIPDLAALPLAVGELACVAILRKPAVNLTS